MTIKHARDIPGELVLGIVEEVNATGRWCMMWDLQEALPDAPYKVILAKMRRLEKQNAIVGCTCGCRGDFVIKGGPLDYTVRPSNTMSKPIKLIPEELFAKIFDVPPWLAGLGGPWPRWRRIAWRIRRTIRTRKLRW